MAYQNVEYSHYIDIETVNLLMRIVTVRGSWRYVMFLYKGVERASHDSDLFAFYDVPESKLIFFDNCLSPEVFEDVSEFVRKDRQERFGGFSNVKR